MPTRRTFLKTTGGAAGAVAAGGVGLAANGGEAAADQAAPAKPAVISARHEIAIEVRLPAAAPVLGELAGRLSRRIARMSAGAIQLVPLAGIDRVADVAILDLVGQDPDAPLADRLFAGLPFGFSARELPVWLSLGGGQTLWDDSDRARGMKPFLAAHLGPAPGIFGPAALETLADLDGRRIVVGGLGARMLELIGGIALAPGSTPAGAGAADADRFAEGLSPLVDLARRGSPPAAWLSGPGLNLQGHAVALRLPIAVHEALGEAEAAILSAAVAEEARIATEEMRLAAATARMAMRESAGVSLAVADPGLAAALHEASLVALGELESDGRLARIIASQRGFQAFLPETANGRGAVPVAAMV